MPNLTQVESSNSGSEVKPLVRPHSGKERAIVPDITGDHIVVLAYLGVSMPDGEKKALHHVKDAGEISDVIRQARVDENGERVWW